jgi:kynurenine formamidase
MQRNTFFHNISIGAAFVPFLLLAVSFFASGCGTSNESLGGTTAPEVTSTEYIAGFAQRLATGDGLHLVDLTYPLSSEGLYWPTGSAFEHEREGWAINEKGYWYASGSFSSAEHLGTHIDAPIHFAEGGLTLAEIPVDRLIGPGVLIDISDRCSTDADATLQPEDLEAWEGQHGAIPAGAVVIVRSGWAKFWPDWNAYYGSDTPEDVTTLHFPGISEAAAAVLAERGVAGVGIDTASIDPGVSSLFEAHQVLGAANVFNLENLTNVESLPASGFVVITMPMKIAEGTGAPARVVALIPDQ